MTHWPAPEEAFERPHRKRPSLKPLLLATAAPALLLLGYATGVFQERFLTPRPVVEKVVVLQQAPQRPSVHDYDSLQAAYDSLEKATLRVPTAQMKPYRAPALVTFARNDPASAIDSIDIAKGSYFIEVDKQRQRVRVWERCDYRLVSEMECSTGKNPGEKSREGDSKTPGGYAMIVSAENSSGWWYEGAPAYGPWFFRLNDGWWDAMGNHAPLKKSTIGIHGTNEPWLLGTRASHGCIRLYNEDVLEAKRNGWLAVGTPVYITPDSLESLLAGPAGLGYERIRKISGK